MKKSKLSGWKVKLSCGALVVYAVLGWYLDMHSLNEAIQMSLGALYGVGIGHKVEKSGEANVKVLKDINDVIRSNQRSDSN